MRIEDIDRISSTSNRKNETTCSKMTDETNKTIKNGINGASSSVSATITTTIQVSRANPIHSGSTNNNNGAAARQIRGGKYDGGNSGSAATGEFTGKCISNDIGRIPTSSHVLGSDNNRLNTPGVGGRLQFFKDGKFILELARAKEGEKSGWISVPRKVFRSPSASSSTITPTYPKNESSTSLSFSDDNSSIQSSPWQRDHCWKQSSPRRGISKELSLYYQRTKQLKLSSDGYAASKVKRRRPYDDSVCKANPFAEIKNGHVAPESKNHSNDENNSSTGNEKSAENAEKAEDDEKIDVEEDDSDTAEKQTSKSTNTNGEERLESGAKLTKIIQKLSASIQTKLFNLSKATIISSPINPLPSSTSSRLADSHYHQPHVSPRKRILREFEKVSLEDSKRSRAKGNSPLSTTSSTGGGLTISPPRKMQSPSSVVVSSSSSLANNNATHYHSVTNGKSESTATTTKAYSSYSIHSLLGGNSNSSKNTAQTTTTMNSYNDPSHLRTMLASPKSPENYSQSSSVGKVSPYSSIGSSSSKKRSPPYSPLHDIHHSRIRSPTVDSIYGNIRSPESHNRTGGSLSRSTPPGMHPYLSSPKYSNSSDSHKLKGDQSSAAHSPSHMFYSPYLSSPKYIPPPNTVSPNPSMESFRLKAELQSNSPNPNARLTPSRQRSPSLLSAFSQSPQHSSSAPKSGRDASPAAGLVEDRREPTTPRTVPKKTASIRQQFASSSLSPSPSHGEHYYKSSSEQKHSIKSEDQRTNSSPENHTKVPTSYAGDLKPQNHVGGVLRSSPSASSSSGMPPSHSPLYYLYPPNNVSSSPHTSSSSYIPSASYYHQYAAAVAALRNPLWMPYPPGVLPSHVAPPSRLLPSSFFPYNGVGATGLAATSHLHPMHLAAGGPLGMPSPMDHQHHHLHPSPSTEDPASLISIKEEHSSDVPLNLSKH